MGVHVTENGGGKAWKASAGRWDEEGWGGSIKTMEMLSENLLLYKLIKQ